MLTHPGSKITALAVITALASVPRRSVEELARPAPPPRMTLSPLAIHEQPLDLDVPPPPLPPRREVSPAPPRREVSPAPPRRPRPFNPWTDPNMPLVRTPDDENLPAWVPIAGRLTVVSACDIAENLGLAPLGTAKNGGCPDAVQLIERENAERRRVAEASKMRRDDDSHDRGPP